MTVKNFANLVNHKNDYGTAAEWYFFATSHDRSSRNAAGGARKWQTATSSLHCPYDK
jgi:hypothetical protein